MQQQEQAWPTLREDLNLHESAPTSDGQPVWVVEDPATNRFFQLDTKSYEVLSRWHLGDAEQIIQSVNRDTSFDVTKEFIEGLIKFFQGQQLFQLETGQSVEMLSKLKKPKQAWYLWLMHHYLFFRVPLVSPDAFLEKTVKYVRPFYARSVFYVVLTVALTGLFLVSRQWDVFAASFVDMFSLQGMIYFMFALGVSKLGHELGHAYMAKIHGCRVPSMGVAFLVLWPMLYTDTNQTWKLKSRKERLSVGAAGMAVEMTFAAFSTLAWALLSDGALRDICLVMATTTWISSLLINVSPFMRFDGYFLLSDMLGLPNLHQRSFALGRWRLREFLFGLGHPIPEKFAPKRELFLILFAYGVWAYRLILFLGIAVLVYSFFIKLVGILLFVVEILWFVLKPIYAELKVWYKLRDEIRQSKRSLWPLGALIVLFMLAIVPLPNSIRASAIVKPEHNVEVYAKTEGRLAQVYVEQGQTVKAGDLLVRLEDPDIIFKRQSLSFQEKRATYQLSLATLSEDYKGETDTILANLASIQVEQDILKEREAALSITASLDGVWLDPEGELSKGQWISGAQRLGQLVQIGQPVLQAYVSEQDIERFDKDAACTYFSLSAPDFKYECEIIEIETLPTRQLSQKELASVNGGLISIREDRDGTYPEQNIYRAVLKMTEPAQGLSFAHTGQVVLSGYFESALVRLYKFVSNTMIKESAW